jgi:hypothetical protein
MPVTWALTLAAWPQMAPAVREQVKWTYAQMDADSLPALSSSAEELIAGIGNDTARNRLEPYLESRRGMIAPHPHWS